MPRRDLDILRRRIKKAEKKVRKLKASTAQKKEEMTQLTNLVENHYQAMVQAREVVHPLTLAAESSNAQLLEFISAWIAENDSD